MKIVEVFGKNVDSFNDSKISINKNDVSQSFSDYKKREPNPMGVENALNKVKTIAALKNFKESIDNNWKTPMTKPRKLQNERKAEECGESQSSLPSAPGYEPRKKEESVSDISVMRTPAPQYRKMKNADHNPMAFQFLDKEEKSQSLSSYNQPSVDGRK